MLNDWSKIKELQHFLKQLFTPAKDGDTIQNPKYINSDFKPKFEDVMSTIISSEKKLNLTNIYFGSIVTNSNFLTTTTETSQNSLK